MDSSGKSTKRSITSVNFNFSLPKPNQALFFFFRVVLFWFGTFDESSGVSEDVVDLEKGVVLILLRFPLGVLLAFPNVDNTELNKLIYTINRFYYHGMY